uniref:Uncharacterized protein n=1 Tax=viral metagenome TaxID=1070528 RepID=A0A6C0H6P7_9ZZZZ
MLYHGSEIIKSFAIFYLFIFCNILLKLFPKSHLKFMVSNYTFIYVAGFLVFYFLITLFSDTRKNIPPIQKLVYTIVYYILFLVTIQLELVYTIMVGLILLVIYLLDSIKEFYIKNKNKDEAYWITLDKPIKIRMIKFEKNQINDINNIEKILDGLIIIISCIGLFKYIITKNNNG